MNVTVSLAPQHPVDNSWQREVHYWCSKTSDDSNSGSSLPRLASIELLILSNKRRRDCVIHLWVCYPSLGLMSGAHIDPPASWLYSQAYQ